jgi:hypothetical protein
MKRVLAGTTTRLGTPTSARPTFERARVAPWSTRPAVGPR